MKDLNKIHFQFIHFIFITVAIYFIGELIFGRFLRLIFRVILFESMFLQICLGLMALLLVYLFIFTFIQFIKRKTLVGKKSLIMISLNILTILMPITGLGKFINFYALYPFRSAAVKLIEFNGYNWSGTVNTYVSLLSDGGQISYFTRSGGKGDTSVMTKDELENLTVMFYQTRYILDNHSSYVYRENGEELMSGPACTTVLRTIQFTENWFWVACS